MIEILSYVLCAYVFMKIGMRIQAFYEEHREEIEEANRDEEDSIEITVNVEMHEDTMYAWDVESDLFLGQGKDMKELEDHIKERVLTEYNSDAIIRLMSNDKRVLAMANI